MFHVCCKKLETKLIGSRDFSFDIFFTQQFSTSDLSRVMHDEVCFNINYVANRKKHFLFDEKNLLNELLIFQY